MRKPRKNYTPVEKVAILRRHLIDRVSISDLCDEYQLSPTLFYALAEAVLRERRRCVRAQEWVGRSIHIADHRRAAR